MYTSHPAGNSLRSFAPKSLVGATRNECIVSFSEFLEMRRVVERLANSIVEFEPDLIPFFATGGIPFSIPAMQVLYHQQYFELVDGEHFHMFPGLSWSGKLNGVDSESLFVKEFGKLVENVIETDRKLRIWTMDATFTGNAICKLIKALHRTFAGLETKPKDTGIKVVAVIDVSRSSLGLDDDTWPLETKDYGTLFLKRSGEFSPEGKLQDRQPTRFVRNDDHNLFDLDITYWPVPAIPTEDRAELIGAHASKKVLGIESLNTVGRLTIDFANGYSPSGTGGGTLGNKVLSWLSKSEDRLPWNKWIPLSEAPPVQPHELNDYEEGKRQTNAGLRLFELQHSEAETATVIEELLQMPGLLSDVEVYCLLISACEEFNKAGTEPKCVPAKLQRKVLASAKGNSKSIPDALKLFRLCNFELAADEPQESDDDVLLKWWHRHLDR